MYLVGSFVVEMYGSIKTLKYNSFEMTDNGCKLIVGLFTN